MWGKLVPLFAEISRVEEVLSGLCQSQVVDSVRMFVKKSLYDYSNCITVNEIDFLLRLLPSLVENQAFSREACPQIP
jgi:hypothetical protein